MVAGSTLPFSPPAVFSPPATRFSAAEFSAEAALSRRRRRRAEGFSCRFTPERFRQPPSCQLSAPASHFLH